MSRRESRGREPEPTGIEALLADCIDRIDREGEGALESVCREHPEEAPRLRLHLSRLRGIDLLGGAAPRPPVPNEAPRRLGDFTLLRPIGRGGMGVVYLARQESLGRDVALKIVRSDCLELPGARERFRRESAAIARLQHPGIVRIHSVGEADGVPYFAMEWIDGTTLAEILRRLGGASPERLSGRDFAAAARGPGADAPEGALADEMAELSWVDVSVRVARAVAEALDHAHGKGVVHRDVKPSNVLVAPSGRVLLADFGLAAVSGADTLTRSATPIGSLPYMSPEQLKGATGEIDGRTDVYSLGVLLYETLTLRSPYLSDSSERTRSLILAGVPEKIRSFNRAVPRDVETVCAKAMSPEKERRYASVGRFAEDLENIEKRRPVAARRAGPLLRARRCAERHPLLATAGFLIALLAATAVIALAGWGGLRKLDELARLGHVRHLLKASSALQPVDAANLPAMRAWCAEAAKLVAEAPRCRASIAELRARALPQAEESRRLDRIAAEVEVDYYTSVFESVRADAPSDAASSAAHRKGLALYENLLEQAKRRTDERSTFDFASAEDRFRHEELVQLLAEIDALDETLGAVRKQVEVAELHAELRKRIGPVTETVSLFSGRHGDRPGRTGEIVGDMTFLESDDSGRPVRLRPFTSEDFAEAAAADRRPVVVSTRAFAGLARLPGEPRARWIHSRSERSGWGTPARSVLYCLPFEVETERIGGAILRFTWCTDDGLGIGDPAISQAGVYLNGTPLGPAFDGGMLRRATTAIADVTRTLLPGATNRLYVNQTDGGGGICCTMFSATVEIARER